jgi:ribonuclease HI
MYNFIKKTYKTEEFYILNFDGGANPNPGKCAGAYVIYDKNKKIIFEGGKFIENGTNNIGEYTGLLIGIEECVQNGIKNLFIEGDSLLVISQISGKWRVKNKNLEEIYKKIMEYINFFDNVACRHIDRKYNGYADSLSDYTLEICKDWKK